MDKIRIDLQPKTDGVAPDWVTGNQAAALEQLQSIYDHVAWLPEQQ